MLSVNLINAQIKLSEMWKAMNEDDHPFKIPSQCFFLWPETLKFSEC